MAIFKIYKDSRGEYRWQLVASNNRIVADSGEGYINKNDTLAAITWVKRFAPSALVVNLTEIARTLSEILNLNRRP